MPPRDHVDLNQESWKAQLTFLEYKKAFLNVALGIVNRENVDKLEDVQATMYRVYREQKSRFYRLKKGE